jgi:glycerophosphoryl diester phosphodiesterase
MKAVRITVITIACLVLALAALVVGARVKGGVSKGREICLAKGIPYHAVIAHRGASFQAPEETVPAYLLARDLGADYLEADIQRTKDGVLIALHDDTFERTTDVAGVFPARKADTVEKFTFAEIRKLDAGSWFNKKFPDKARKSYAGLKVASLEEILSIAVSGINRPGIYLEVKEPKRFPGIEKQLVEMLAKNGWIGGVNGAEFRKNGKVTVGLTGARVILQSFDAECVAKFREFAPSVPRLYLYDGEEVKKRGWDAVLKTARDNDAGLGPSGYEAYPGKNGDGHAAGLFIHVYTINKAWQARLLSIFGADGFFTDRTDMLLDFHGIGLPDTPENILAKHGY